MSRVIKLKNSQNEEEYILLEMQGIIEHNNENKYYNMNLGKMELISKVYYNI
jgi:hypothetical protein